MNLPYTIFIKPLESFIGLIFELLAGTGMGYGPALMLLSLVVTAVTVPFYYLAERWKRQEEVVQRKMGRDMASIKAHYTGQKRFYLTRNAHRLYGYSPLSPLKTSLGLLIQIPFFFAPYLYLSRFSGYAGESFLILQDLGKPDGLLWGANILPFIMTAINVGASLLYTKKRGANDTFQLLGLAGLFLFVLYDSPSALLIYWTMNNILAIPKNALLARLLPRPESDEDNGAPSESILVTIRRFLEREDPAIPAFILAFFLLGIQAFWELRFERSFKYLILLTALAGFALSVLYLWRRFKGKLSASPSTLLALAAEWILFGVSAYFLLFARRQNAYLSNKSVKLLTVMVQDLVIMTTAYGLIQHRTSPDTGRARSDIPLAAAKHPLRLFAFAFAFVTAYLFLLSPILIYFSSPKDIGMGLAELFLRNAPPAALLFLVGVGLFRLLSRRTQARAIGGVIASIILILVYNYLIRGDYGTLDELHLEKDYLLDSPRIGAFLLDVIVVALALFAARAALKMQQTTILACLAAVTVAFSVQIAVNATKTDLSAGATEEAKENSELPAEYQDLHRFSTTSTNIVVILADMFNGNYLGRLVEEYPEYREKLDGFTWYPNTLSISSTTVTSVPAMLSGYRYTPEAMNEMPGLGRGKYDAAVGDLCDTMVGRGFESSIVDMTYLDLPALSARYPGKVHTSSASDYIGAWKERTGYAAAEDGGSGKNRLLVMVTLFQSTPSILKSALYDDGSWLIFRKSFQIKKMARNQVKTYAYLDLLPSLSSAVEGGATFKFIHTQFTHEPFGITEQGDIIKNEFPDPKTGTKSFVDGKGAFNNAKKMIDFVVAWSDWMKKAGVWDNTYFVLVSDHGNNALDGNFSLPSRLSNPLNDWEVSKARAIFLVKNPGESGALRIDDRFLSNADLAALIRRAAGETVEDPTVGPVAPHRRLTYSRYYGKWNDFMTSDRVILSTYEVSDDLRIGENWNKR